MCAQPTASTTLSSTQLTRSPQGSALAYPLVQAVSSRLALGDVLTLSLTALLCSLCIRPPISQDEVIDDIDISKPLSHENFQATLARYPIGGCADGLQPASPALGAVLHNPTPAHHV